MSVVGLDHVQIACPPGTEESLRSFYGGLVGLPELPKPPALAARGGVWFAVGAQQLHCGVEEPFSPARKAHPCLLVVGLDSLAARLEDAGYPIRWDTSIPRTRRFHTDDPVGNRLELREA